MVDIPEKEPRAVRAGDTWEWTRQLDDYVSPTWVLSYSLRYAGQTDAITITATADGSGGHAVSVAPATTKGYPASLYSWIARVTDGSAVYTIGTGSLRVLPDLAQINVDFQSDAQKAFSAIEAVMLGKATHDQAAFTIGDQSVSRMSWDELLKAYDYYKRRVANELGVKTNVIYTRMPAR